MTKPKVTPKKIRERFTSAKWQFSNIEDYQDYVRRHGTLDVMVIDKILFTQEEYDMSGKQISYFNKRNMLTVMVETSNRYGATGFTDAIVSIDDACAYRNDINFYD
jgi:hypothetical protein